MRSSPLLAITPFAVSIADAAKLSGLSRTVLYQAIAGKDGADGSLPHLPSIKVGGRRLVRVDTLRDWLTSLEVSDQHKTERLVPEGRE